MPWVELSEEGAGKNVERLPVEDVRQLGCVRMVFREWILYVISSRTIVKHWLTWIQEKRKQLFHGHPVLQTIGRVAQLSYGEKRKRTGMNKNKQIVFCV